VAQAGYTGVQGGGMSLPDRVRLGTPSGVFV
jgi:hypothetical protein